MKRLLLIPLFLIACSGKEKSPEKKESVQDKITNSVRKYINAEIIGDNKDIRLDTLYSVYLDSITEADQLKSIVYYSQSKVSNIRNMDSLNYYQRLVENVAERYKVADSTKTLDYGVGYVFKVTNTKSNLTKQDSLHFIVDKNFGLMNQTDYVKTVIGTLQNPQ